MLARRMATVPRGGAIVSTPRPLEGGDDGDEYVTLQEAATLLGVSRFQVSRLITRLQLPVYERPADRRIKLLRKRDVEAALRPRPRKEGAP